MYLADKLCSVTPYNKSSYTDLKAIVDNSYTQLTLGGRRVYAMGYAGSVSLKELVQKVEDLVDSNLEFSEDERSIGVSVFSSFETLYAISRDQEKRVNWVTALFLWIQESIWDGCGCNVGNMLQGNSTFDCYTEKQAKEVFGSIPDDDSRYTWVRNGKKVWYGGLALLSKPEPNR